MRELFSSTVMIGRRSRTAVSTSMPAVPNARSPMMLMTSLSGQASLAPSAMPRPVPSWVDLPQPR